MAPNAILITGSNRGIGLELVKHYLSSKNPPKFLFSTYRNEASSAELLELSQANSNMYALKLDITKPASFPDFVREVENILGKGNGLNLLLNNSGFMDENRSLDKITAEDMMYSYEVNCVGPLLFTRELLPLLKTTAKAGQYTIDNAACIFMSSIIASIQEYLDVQVYPYRCSKTALNMAMKSLSVDLKDTGILILALHPGWVKTRMGGENAPIDTKTCVEVMAKTLEGLTEKDHGGFLSYDNTPIQW